MKNLTPKGYLRILFLILFGAVFADVLRMVLGLDIGTSRFFIYIVSASLLSFTLYSWLIQLHQNRALAVLGLVPPLGFAFGLYLYLYTPLSGERHPDGR